MTLHVELGHPDHAYYFASDLSNSDKIAFHATCEESDTFLAEYMEECLNECEQVFTITDDDGVIQGVFAHKYKDVLFEVGEVFLLSREALWTNHFSDMTKIFRREVLPGLTREYKVVQTSARSKNRALLKWLISAGFDPVRFGEMNGEPFTLLEKRGTKS